jgi:hypothetical protein
MAWLSANWMPLLIGAAAVGVLLRSARAGRGCCGDDYPAFGTAAEDDGRTQVGERRPPSDVRNP